MQRLNSPRFCGAAAKIRVEHHRQIRISCRAAGYTSALQERDSRPEFQDVTGETQAVVGTAVDGPSFAALPSVVKRSSSKMISIRVGSGATSLQK